MTGKPKETDKVTVDPGRLTALLGLYNDFQDEESLTEEEQIEYDAYQYASRAIIAEEMAKEYDLAEEAVPAYDVGIDDPGESEVWVWNSEVWSDGSPSIGWHKTSMHSCYGKGDDAYCNWWNEPVGGRTGRNPYWLPGDLPECDLPDLVPVFEELARLSREAHDRASARMPEYKGRTPPLYSVLTRAMPLMKFFASQGEADEAARVRDARQAKVEELARTKYLTHETDS